MFLPSCTLLYPTAVTLHVHDYKHPEIHSCFRRVKHFTTFYIGLQTSWKCHCSKKPLTAVRYHPYAIQYLYLATGNNSVVAGPGDNKENVIVPSQSSPLLCILMYMFHVSAKLYLTLSYLYIVFLAQMYSSITYYGSHGSSTLWNLP